MNTKHGHINVHSYVDDDYAAYMLYVPGTEKGIRSITSGRRAVINGKAFKHYQHAFVESRIGWIIHDSMMDELTEPGTRKEHPAWI